LEIEWGFFDRRAHTDESARNLPHKEQVGAVTFVTLRLADSMPKQVVKQWHQELADWLIEHGIENKTADEMLLAKDIAIELKKDFRRFKNRKWNIQLDNCHGACVFRDFGCRLEVAKSIQHFNGVFYDLDSFVVMPNHAHVLIQMREVGLRKRFREIQRFSARAINLLLEREGDLWQGEPFDHIVRGPEQFEYLRKYIFDNPKKAGLSNDEFTYWNHIDT